MEKKAAPRAVRIGTDDEPLSLEAVNQRIMERFKFSASHIKERAQQWEGGLLSDDELGWALRDLTLANADRLKLARCQRDLLKLARNYGIRK